MEEEEYESRRSWTTPTPRFNQGVATLNPLSRTGGPYSLNSMLDFPRFPDLRNTSWKIPWLIGISKLASQLQD